MPRSLKFAFAAALAVAAAAPAFAREEVNAQVVRYGDLNLKFAGDADTLINRIDNASENVCGDRSGPMPLTERSDVNMCAHESAQVAVAEVGHPVVSGRYYGYTPEVVVDDGDTAKK